MSSLTVLHISHWLQSFFFKPRTGAQNTLWSTLLCVALLGAGCTTGQSQETPTASVVEPSPNSPIPKALVPRFKLRARVLKVQGETPAKRDFRFQLGSPGRPLFTDDFNAPNGSQGQPLKTQGDAWSEWGKFDQAVIDELFHADGRNYPNPLTRRLPIVLGLYVFEASNAAPPTPVEIEAQVVFDEAPDKTVALTGSLLSNDLPRNLPGLTLGLLIWREDAVGGNWTKNGAPRAATMREYNRRYWSSLKNIEIPEQERPKKFILGERFIGGDDDEGAWREGIEQLSKIGVNVLELPPSASVRKVAQSATTIRRTAGGGYNPPGYTFDFTPAAAGDPSETTTAILDAWAKAQAQPYLNAGYKPHDVAIYALADEPGWYYPSMLKPLSESPTALARFRDYLKDNGLTPADVGAANWDGVLPIGRSAYNDLASRRLFYWTTRFFSYDSARHFAASTRALEKAFYPGMPIFTNWNFYSGRFYVPGSVANNPDGTSPDAAMGGHDWFEFARLRGGTVLWGEDWFSDADAFNWSNLGSRFNSAARKGNVMWGGYIIGLTSGDREDGLLQKVLAIVGNGGKAIKYYMFGPEYMFPGNSYSDRSMVSANPVNIPAKIARAQRLIGVSEDVLWPGVRPRSAVAILHPRSSQVWDPPRNASSTGAIIMDATNLSFNGNTVDYMAEVADLYQALTHAGIATDWVEENDLSAKGLAGIKVLYVTAPNLPAEMQQVLAQWASAGGTLVTTSGAAQADRYNEPSRVLSAQTGIEEAPRERWAGINVPDLKEVAKGESAFGAFTAFGPRGELKNFKGVVKAKFADGTPAVIENAVAKGRAIHFAWLPGISYFRSSNGTKDKLPVGFSAAIRALIAYPVKAAKVELPVVVSTPLIEAPMLVSDAGAAVTLLNWSGEPQKNLTLTIKTTLPIKSVSSAQGEKVAFKTAPGKVTVTLPNLVSGDILSLRLK